AENAVSGHDGYYQKVDRPAAGLEHDSCTDGDLLRRAYARVTPLCLDVKGQMNGFAALYIHPHRRYVVDIGGSRSSRCRLHINFDLFLHSFDFTQNLGVPQQLIFEKSKWAKEKAAPVARCGPIPPPKGDV